MYDTRSNRARITDRRVLFGSLIVIAFVVYFGLQAIGYPLLSVAGFVVFFGGAIGLAAGSSQRFWDERDQQVHERAAGYTVAMFGWLSAVAFPTIIGLEAIGHLEPPAWLAPISAAVIVFYLTYGLIQIGIRMNR